MPANDERHNALLNARTSAPQCGAAAIVALALAACTTTSNSLRSTPGTTAAAANSPGYAHRGGIHVRRAVLRPGLRQVPPAAPRRDRELRRRGQ